VNARVRQMGDQAGFRGKPYVRDVEKL
jgi:hypothetical protein